MPLGSSLEGTDAGDVATGSRTAPAPGHRSPADHGRRRHPAGRWTAARSSSNSYPWTSASRRQQADDADGARAAEALSATCHRRAVARRDSGRRPDRDLQFYLQGPDLQQLDRYASAIKAAPRDRARRGRSRLVLRAGQARIARAHQSRQGRRPERQRRLHRHRAAHPGGRRRAGDHVSRRRRPLRRAVAPAERSSATRRQRWSGSTCLPPLSATCRSRAWRRSNRRPGPRRSNATTASGRS